MAIRPQKLKGFRDFLPAQAKQRYAIKTCIFETALRYGYLPVDTPAIEYATTLLGEGGDTDKEMYRFTDQGQRDVALRYDLTMPLARFIAENAPALVFPFKKIQIGEVWRGEKPQKGRYRQFCQADLDIMGSSDITAEMDLLSCLLESLTTLIGATPLTVQINHRYILSYLVKQFLKIDTPQNELSALIAIDKLNKIGPQAVGELLRKMTPQGQIEDFLQLLIEPTPDQNTKIDVIKRACHQDQRAVKSLKDIELLVKFLTTRFADKHININFTPSIARGLAYYTGTVFEVVMTQRTDLGSICSGGRYDNLLTRFGKEARDSVGGSIGVDRLLTALEELNLVPNTVVDVFVALADPAPELINMAHQLASTLRSKTLHSVEVTSRLCKLKQQIKEADKKGAQHLIILGEKEMKANLFTYKNMTTGTQTSLTLNDLIATLQSTSHTSHR